MKKLVIIFMPLMVFLTYGLFLSQFRVEIIPAALERENPEGFYDYKGAINVHTTYSTGSAKIDEVVLAAQEAELDFVFITDLNAFGKPRDYKGYSDKVLVLLGDEYSYLETRLLNFAFAKTKQFTNIGQSQVVLADQLSQTNKETEDGLLVLAHPFKKGYQWRGSIPPGLDGVEIINLKSLWQDAWLNKKVSFFWTLLTYPFNDRLSLLRLFRHPDKEIELWDTQSKSRKFLAIAGSDAEAKVKMSKKNYVSFPSYQTLFSIVSNHILLQSELTGDSESDTKKIYEGLRKGQFYMSLDSLANPKGFNAFIVDSEDKIYPMGSQIQYRENLKLIVNLPAKPNVPFDVEVIKDGKKVLTSNSKETTYVLHSPGTYRIVVRVIPTLPLPDGKKWIPWIFTNNFHVKKEG